MAEPVLPHLGDDAEFPEPAEELKLAAEAIAAADVVALACHVNPDGDALGSLLALHHLCLANGKPSIASWPDPFVVAPHYTYLPGLDLATAPSAFPAEPDVMVTFDCGSMGRLGNLAGPATAARSAGGLIVLDHHASNDRYGSINVVDADAAATAVVVHRLAQLLGWELNREVAMCLYTGLVTDTGRFQYANVTPEVFSLAAELAGFGLPIAEMNRQLFETARFCQLQLVSACLARAELDSELGLVATWITEDDLAVHGVVLDEMEGLIDLVRRSAEAPVSCVAKETPEGIKVSLRSNTDLDVSLLAGRFGGGGHRFAAGFCAEGTVAEVLAGLRRALAEQLGR